MKLTLRPYQAEAISAVHEFWRGEGGNPLVVLPTGAGKSLVIADLVRGLLDAFPQMRIGMVTHVKELIDQNAQELWRLWPGAPIGIYSAGLGRRDTRAQVLFMGIQSVHRKAQELGGFDLLLIDEAHLIPRNTATMYGRFIGDCLDINPNMSVCGMTATPYRLDSGRLDRGKDRLFDKVVYEANVRDLIADGYLSNLISKATDARIDTSNVHVRAGEFKADELEAAALNIVESAVTEIIEWGTKENRQGWLAFCTGVDHATQVRDLMRQNGISCESVTGETPKGDRDRIIQSYKARKIKCLTSVGVLTTGFNAPHVDLIALLRPTLSTGLFVQMIGRGFRLSPGKDDCRVLDFAGNAVRHGPVDDVRPRSEKGGGSFEGEEKVKPDTVQAKECPKCQTLVGLATMTCPTCDHEWPKPEPRHEAEASADAPILSTEKIKPRWLEVKDTSFHLHEKIGAPTSLRVEYDTGLQIHKEWLCFEHRGGAKGRAGMVWRRMGGELPVPQTSLEGMRRQGELRTVTAISVRRQKPGSKYFNVVDRQYTDAKALEAAE